jgi:UDP-GlcNAc:undecaprenyl-phosphate/decaprenyl-phosphate GlcNAc-1-phosphate transferase
MQPLAAALLAALVSLLLGRLAIAAAARLRFLDPPGERKLQARPIPVLGGPAILLGLAAGLAAWFPADEGSLIARWLAAGAWLVLVGMRDDRRGLGPLPRLAAQVAAALLFAPELCRWLGPGLAGLALPLGLLWLVGLINALNFLDNMDGAAASTALWTALALALALRRAEAAALAAALWPLAGALVGFLWWNRPPARLYMGDAGATFLGLTLGLFALLASARGAGDPWLAPLFLALPLYDTGSVLWIRWREGRRLWVGDRRHATHRLLARGASVARALATINAWTLAAASLALVWGARPGGLLPLAAALVVALAVFGWERSWERKQKAADPPRRKA